ncbi:hypothetical protein BKP37_10095 [Anaerobacillus alkalilacustris]|uniref:DUF3231 domain-containing protein n=1 Tax=Anaerobacillus alkalilacustris TaxID=393763 RepID=A0A1S2LM89_9BACI|nr:DUF3231 family protein [Anaerobacillus alkalilacustris]OIJ13622.1 hypothetical protein BKP37_10095 [Anaerobacillus alkalilacustris]
MKTHKINLITPEMGALWTTYIQNSALGCFYEHFLQHMQGNEIKPIVEEALTTSKQCLKETKELFVKEEFPIPDGFSDKDVYMNAPPLLTDLFEFF